MSDRRFRLDVTAFVLLAAGLLVALCVLGHDAHGGGPVHPAPEPTNPLGPPGAWLAQSLYEGLGVAVYLLLASWFVLVVLLFVRRTWLRWAVRLVGWLVLLPSAAVAAEWLGERWPESLPERGGTLGAWLTLLLRERLAPLAQALAIGGTLLIGLALGL